MDEDNDESESNDEESCDPTKSEAVTPGDALLVDDQK